METVYLLHFSEPISPEHTCQHYIGYTKNLKRRLSQHKRGKGANLCKVAKERGITWEVVMIWEIPDGQGRAKELEIKSSHGNRICPKCKDKHNAKLREKRRNKGIR